MTCKKRFLGYHPYMLIQCRANWVFELNLALYFFVCVNDSFPICGTKSGVFGFKNVTHALKINEV